jgi:hypothetical protein
MEKKNKPGKGLIKRQEEGEVLKFYLRVTRKTSPSGGFYNMVWRE